MSSIHLRPHLSHGWRRFAIGAALSSHWRIPWGWMDQERCKQWGIMERLRTFRAMLRGLRIDIKRSQTFINGFPSLCFISSFKDHPMIDPVDRAVA